MITGNRLIESRREIARSSHSAVAVSIGRNKRNETDGEIAPKASKKLTTGDRDDDKKPRSSDRGVETLDTMDKGTEENWRTGVITAVESVDADG